VVTATPFFRGTTGFWGTEQGPTVFLWEGLVEEGQEECERVIRAQRLGSVESSATNEKKLHYKRV
jgi:hypothetical protein